MDGRRHRRLVLCLVLLGTTLLGGCYYSPYPAYYGGGYYGAYPAAPVVVVGRPYYRGGYWR